MSFQSFSVLHLFNFRLVLGGNRGQASLFSRSTATTEPIVTQTKSKKTVIDNVAMTGLHRRHAKPVPLWKCGVP